MTIDDVNELFRRMAFEAPWHTGYCAACPCPAKLTHGRLGLLSRHDYGPCPLLPLDGAGDAEAPMDDVRERLARCEWTGAGTCLACHAVLPWPGECPDGAIQNAQECHRPGCEVLAILTTDELTPGRR